MADRIETAAAVDCLMGGPSDASHSNGGVTVIASVFRVPAGSSAANLATVEQVAKAPGLIHLYLLSPADPEQDRLSVLLWEKEEQLDAYIESDLGQQVLAANPNATRLTYSVQKVR